MPTNETFQAVVGVPLGWATAELSPADRPAALLRLQELGIDKWIVAKVCNVDASRVTAWSKKGFPASKGNYAMSVLDRLSLLAEHMRTDLELDDEQARDFIVHEPNSYDWQIDDSWEKTNWRHASLLQSNIFGYRKTPQREYQIIEERMMERFPDNYRAYLGRLQESARSNSE